VNITGILLPYFNKNPHRETVIFSLDWIFIIQVTPIQKAIYSTYVSKAYIHVSRGVFNGLIIIVITSNHFYYPHYNILNLMTQS
jgi:hypothetical protein